MTLYCSHPLIAFALLSCPPISIGLHVKASRGLDQSNAAQCGLDSGPMQENSLQLCPPHLRVATLLPIGWDSFTFLLALVIPGTPLMSLLFEHLSVARFSSHLGIYGQCPRMTLSILPQCLSDRSVLRSPSCTSTVASVKVTLRRVPRTNIRTCRTRATI